MYRTMRDIDRRLHLECYPQVFYHEIYVLEGGYKEFHSHHPEHCEGSYVPMADKTYKDECKTHYSRTKKLFKQYSAKEACVRLQD